MNIAKLAACSVLIAALGSGFAYAQSDMDKLTRARLAAIDGDHATCAKLADEARRGPHAVWQAHQIYATCQAFVMEAQKGKIPADAYIAGLNKSIDALHFLLATPGIINSEEQRGSVEFVIEEYEKRIAKAKG